MHKCVESRTSWDASVKTSAQAIRELEFWLGNAKELNSKGRQLRLAFSDKSIVNMFTDASGAGYGGYLQVGRSDVTYTCKAGDKVRESTSFVAITSSQKLESPEVDMINKAVLPEVRLLKTSDSRGGTVKLPEVSLQESLEFPEVNFGRDPILEGSVVTGSWLEHEVENSSTWRELEALHRVLRSNICYLCNSHVYMYTDNANLVCILKSGSNIETLQCISLKIYDVCRDNTIQYTPVWIPRKCNATADYLSRCLDSDDWSIAEDLYKLLDNRWGPHTIDRFASHYNAKCDRFNSKWWVPGTEAIDCFSQSWSGEINWLVPPPSRVLECIHKISEDACIATLIIPEWKSAPFWTELYDNKGCIKKPVCDVVYLPTKGSVIPCLGNNGVFERGTLSFRMMALRIDALAGR